jgi:hypothetical protein
MLRFSLMSVEGLRFPHLRSKTTLRLPRSNEAHSALPLLALRCSPRNSAAAYFRDNPHSPQCPRGYAPEYE